MIHDRHIIHFVRFVVFSLVCVCFVSCNHEPEYVAPNGHSTHTGIFEQYRVANESHHTITLSFDHVVGHFEAGSYHILLDTFLTILPDSAAGIFDDDVVGVDHDLELRPSMFKHYWWFLGRQTALYVGSFHVLTWTDELQADTLTSLGHYDFYDRASWSTDTLSVPSDSVAPGLQIMHTFTITQAKLDSLM